MAGDEQSLIKPKCNILIGICSCLAYPKRREACRDTWLKHSVPGIDYKFFIGNKAPAPPEADVVTLPVADTYKALTCKGLEFYKWSVKNYEFDWLFKCDDDTYCVLDRLSAICDPEADMIGAAAYVNWRGTPSGGAGYMMSRELVEYIVANENDVPLVGAEDVIFGSFATKNGFTIKPDARLVGTYRVKPAQTNDQVTCHWIKPHQMRELERQYYAK